jgi:hypothetical protein
MKEPIQFFYIYIYIYILVLMIGFHSCENQRAIFNPIFTCNGVNWFSL